MAPSKKVTITISPNQACSPAAPVSVKVPVLTGPLSDLQPVLRLPHSSGAQSLLSFLSAGNTQPIGLN